MQSQKESLLWRYWYWFFTWVQPNKGKKRKGSRLVNTQTKPSKGYFRKKDNVCTHLQQAPVVQTLDSAIHWINHYPLDNSVGFASVYPLDSDLSAGQRYPSFEQLAPGLQNKNICTAKPLAHGFGHMTLGCATAFTLERFWWAFNFSLTLSSLD